VGGNEGILLFQAKDMERAFPPPCGKVRENYSNIEGSEEG
jgi:hypothetical protein